jgi:hypothetical protein
VTDGATILAVRQKLKPPNFLAELEESIRHEVRRIRKVAAMRMLEEVLDEG